MSRQYSTIIQPSTAKKEPTPLFKIQKAAKWVDDAKDRAKPKMLFGEFWFEGEICVLFADSNVGKSILAVQIADSISAGERIKPMALEVEKSVLYFDFELSDFQFTSRYLDDNGYPYQFCDKLYRCEIDPEAETPTGFATFEEYTLFSIEQSVIASKSTVLIIDNLTYLAADSEQSKAASALMKGLKAIKAKYNLSILLLAHTPKRCKWNPITKNDLQGSRMVLNFVDSAFAIGESQQDKNFRYVKQIKERSCEKLYGSSNVVMYEIAKKDAFLCFDFLGFGRESEHLATYDGEALKEEVIKIYENDPTTSLQLIADTYNTYPMKIHRIIKKYKDQQEANRKKDEEFKTFVEQEGAKIA